MYYRYGCSTKFDIWYALNCKKRGFITARHNNIRYGVTDLASKAFTPTHVHDDPKIYTGTTGTAVHEGKDKLKGIPSQDVGDMKGDLFMI